MGGAEGKTVAESGAWCFFGEGFPFVAQSGLDSEVEWENRKSKHSGDTEAGAPCHSAVINDYKLDDIKQHTLLILQFWSSEDHDRSQRTKRWCGAMYGLEAPGENPCLDLPGF